ncbi:MAG: hypothetical protein KGL35_12915 [Bradyrhizobium sp.]|nr:hypothetical protein [Pseudomonadota bacterium]MDE2469610.1 hypothetical protein [Bradyrhizobium sp.]
MPVQNAEIAGHVRPDGRAARNKGDNPFRSRAYRNAARVIERLPKSITSLLKAGEDLSELPGIGKDLAGKIATIVATHHFDVLDKLKRDLPGVSARLPLFRAWVRNASSCLTTNLVSGRSRICDARSRPAACGSCVASVSKAKKSSPPRSPNPRSRSGSSCRRPKRRPRLS